MRSTFFKRVNTKPCLCFQYRIYRSILTNEIEKKSIKLTKHSDAVKSYTIYINEY